MTQCIPIWLFTLVLIGSRFILNGLTHANEILGRKEFDLDEWQVIGEYVYDNEGGRHQAFYSPIRDVVVLGETIKAHERVQVEQSLKYSKEGCRNLWRSAGMIEADRWMTTDEIYGEWSTNALSNPENMGVVLLPQRAVPRMEMSFSAFRRVCRTQPT